MFPVRFVPAGLDAAVVSFKHHQSYTVTPIRDKQEEDSSRKRKIAYSIGLMNASHIGKRKQIIAGIK